MLCPASNNPAARWAWVMGRPHLGQGVPSTRLAISQAAARL